MGWTVELNKQAIKRRLGLVQDIEKEPSSSSFSGTSTASSSSSSSTIVSLQTRPLPVVPKGKVRELAKVKDDLIELQSLHYGATSSNSVSVDVEPIYFDPLPLSDSSPKLPVIFEETAI